jgi:threonine/homoserine/homoserine lactone efflux protein
VVLGIVLLVIGGRYLRSRPRGGIASEQPGWMAGIDHFSALQAAGLGLALSVLNPKNLVLVVSAAGVIASAGIDRADQLIALATFTVVASIGIAVPIAAFLLLGDRSEPLLARMKEWLTRNNAMIMFVVCLVLGAHLILDGLALG